jgi:uncharacterized membrane protein
MKRANEENMETADDGLSVPSRFFLLLLVGFMLIVVGVAVVLVSTVFNGSGSVSGGTIIFIGPFPIVIGAGPDVASIVLFSILSYSKHSSVFSYEKKYAPVRRLISLVCLLFFLAVI